MTVTSASEQAFTVEAELEQADVHRAAVAWENATHDAEQRYQWARADEARLHWGLCLHRLGRCDDAVTVLLQTRDDSEHSSAVAAQILCLRLLGWCGRHDDAAALWITLETGTTPTVRGSALNVLLHPRNSTLNDIDDRGHDQVCAYRGGRRTGPTTPEADRRDHG
ncbi:hypothetical protein [Actinoplanes couchii]|uniref:hypothetical protein n=1 Tax=Actinoplanes couchii TaxID=403638 RepID=UPI001943AF10|nr:hypothetical protein [Actinoplanes couchii]MDR6316046.1 hypothetical protein [Actinoplanes couchii]